MTARERILAIKLLEKQERNHEYAERIGIQVSVHTHNSMKKEGEYGFSSPKQQY